MKLEETLGRLGYEVIKLKAQNRALVEFLKSEKTFDEVEYDKRTVEIMSDINSTEVRNLTGLSEEELREVENESND